MVQDVMAVIGAAWGDEGKGVVTDSLADHTSVVVRINGGAQAGHTVQDGGRRHVFRHVGAGALQGATTYLSRFFIHNPITLDRELAELAALGVSPAILADPRGRLTTPLEMMLNQIAEQARGQARHGSCGLGINETVERDRQFARLRIGQDPAKIADELAAIRTEWVPRRLQALGVTDATLDALAAQGEDWRARLADRRIDDFYLDLLNRLRPHIGFAEERVCRRFPRVIFEGAQGLLLDEKNRAMFPHLTRSRTGLTNAATIARRIGLPDITPIHVIRAYATRHGAGPFPTERGDLRHDDPTNAPGQWQGTLRFGDLDLDLVMAAIHKDLAEANFPLAPAKMVVTCLDQVGPEIRARLNGEIVTLDHTGLAGALAPVAPGGIAGWAGPDRHDRLPVMLRDARETQVLAAA